MSSGVSISTTYFLSENSFSLTVCFLSVHEDDEKVPPRFAVRLSERMDVSPQQSLVHRKNP